MSPSSSTIDLERALWTTLGGESEQRNESPAAVALLRAGMRDLAALVEVCKAAIEHEPGLLGAPVVQTLSLVVRLAEFYPTVAEHFEVRHQSEKVP